MNDKALHLALLGLSPVEQKLLEIEEELDHLQQKHHPFSVTGNRAAFSFPISLDDDEWEEP